MNKILLLFLFFLLFNVFPSKHIEAASPKCISKNNQIVWGSKAVNLDVDGRFTVLKKTEKTYTKDAKGNFVASKKTLKPKSLKLVYSKVKKGKVTFYRTGKNEYVKASKNVRYEKIPGTIHQCVEDKVYNERIKSIISGAKKQKSEVAKIVYVHDYLVTHVKYDSDAAWKYLNTYDKQGAILYGESICWGYADTFNFLMKKLGIQSIVLTSPEMNHAWNMVKLNNQWYHIDVTFNDNDLGYFDYSDFLTTDAQMKKNHKWTYSKYPKATSTKYSYVQSMDSGYNNIRIYHDNNYFYYYDNTLEGICRISLDGTNKKLLLSKDIVGMVYLNNYVYVEVMNAGYTFYKLTPEGKKTELLTTNEWVNGMYISNGHVYYTIYGKKGAVLLD